MTNVIIFGGEHYNALGVARVFGINGIKPQGILVLSKEMNHHSYAKYSRYWDKVWIVEDEEEGIQLLLKLGCEEKQALIPTSDGAETAIDNNLDALKPFYYLPGIRDTQSATSALMDKYNQCKWASDLGIKIAKTWLYPLGEPLPDDLCYPCIIKPVASSEGDKRDIRRCDTPRELQDALHDLDQKNYRRILIQEFLQKDYEMELWGCILKNSKKIPYLLSRHMREWPVIGGSVSCHQFLLDPQIRAQAEAFLSSIQSCGYTGNIDIELFMVQNEIYLNEVNFRNSGDVYACFYNELYYPFIWYKDIIGDDISNMNMTYSDQYYAMNELTDCKQVLSGNISLGQWLHDIRHCKDFAFYFPSDMKPAVMYVLRIFERKFCKLIGK